MPVFKFAIVRPFLPFFRLHMKATANPHRTSNKTAFSPRTPRAIGAYDTSVLTFWTST